MRRIKWMRKGSRGPEKEDGTMARNKRERMATAYVSVRHVFKDPGEFEVDASFLDALRDKRVSNRAFAEEFESLKRNVPSFRHDAFFQDDATTVSDGPDEDASPVDEERGRAMTWCSEPWDAENDESDIAGHPAPPPRSTAPPVAPRTTSTFFRLSRMVTRRISFKGGKEATGAPPLPARPSLAKKAAAEPSNEVSSEAFAPPFNVGLSDDEQDGDTFEVEAPRLLPGGRSSGEVPLFREIHAVKRKSSEKLSLRRRSDFSPPLFKELDGFVERTSVRGKPAKTPHDALVMGLKQRRQYIASTASAAPPARHSAGRPGIVVEAGELPPPPGLRANEDEPADAQSGLLAQIRARRVPSSKPAPREANPALAKRASSKRATAMRPAANRASTKRPVAAAQPPPAATDEGDVDLTKYRIMLKAGLPEGAVIQKMTIEGVDPALLGL